jgi:hypothetical protein
VAAGVVVPHSAWAGVLAECAAFLNPVLRFMAYACAGRCSAFSAALRFATGSHWVNAYQRELPLAAH